MPLVKLHHFYVLLQNWQIVLTYFIWILTAILKKNHTKDYVSIADFSNQELLFKPKGSQKSKTLTTC